VFTLAAHAHSIDLFAITFGDGIHGMVQYADGAPVANAEVEVTWTAPGSADGENGSATFETDGDGKFQYQPTARGEYLFTCRTPDGHRAAYSVQYRLPDARSEPLPRLWDREMEEAANSAVERQIGSLRTQLHEYEQRTRLRDVLGGIGYILGLAGVVALIKTRRRET